MKLYKVEVIYQTVILAESEQDAERNAGYVIKKEDDADPQMIMAEEVTNVAQLPAPWDGECRPWGERDPMDRTIGQVLANMADMTSRPKSD